MKIGFFSKFLLSHSALLAEFADVFADFLVRLKSGHGA
jgi:hypothetical protein